MCLVMLASSGERLSVYPEAHAVAPRAASGEGSVPDTHPALSREAMKALPAPALSRLLEIAASPLQPPILLPERPELLREAQVTSGPSWHGVAMRGIDYSVYVHASAVPIDVPGVKRPPVRIPSIAVPRISRTHEIVTAHFVAWGSAWDVDIECLGGLDHPLCGDDILVHALIRTLKRLEGSP